MHRSIHLVLLLALALAAGLYRLAFVTARRLAVEERRAHAPERRGRAPGRPAEEAR